MCLDLSYSQWCVELVCYSIYLNFFMCNNESKPIPSLRTPTRACVCVCVGVGLAKVKPTRLQHASNTRCKRASGYPHASSKPDKISALCESFLIHSRNSLQVLLSDGLAEAIYSRAGNRVLRTNCPQRHERCDREPRRDTRARVRLQLPVPSVKKIHLCPSTNNSL